MRYGMLGLLTVLSVGVGCGGSSTRTRVLISNITEQIPAGFCGPIEGPYAVPTGASMAFTVEDTPTGIGIDSLDVGIIDDVNAQSCNFAAGFGSAQDVFVTSDIYSDSGPVPAGTYDFVAGCANIVDDCIFVLHWTATY